VLVSFLASERPEREQDEIDVLDILEDFPDKGLVRAKVQSIECHAINASRTNVAQVTCPPF
jgi:hypothetical protein